jgi:hypothetical protein
VKNCKSSWNPSNITVFPPYEDTYITNLVSDDPIQAYDSVSQQTVTIHDHTDAGYTGSSVLYRERETVKVGISGGVTWRGVVLVRPQEEITNELEKTVTGITTDYNILSGKMVFLSTDPSKTPTLKASFLPFDAGIDQTVSWERTSDTPNGRNWNTPGGDITEMSSFTTVNGAWQPDGSVVFDITNFLLQWKNSRTPLLPIVIWSEEPNSLVELQSKNNDSKKIGDKTLLNCRFFREGEFNTFNTEGVRVSITTQNSNVEIVYTDVREEALKSWQSLMNSVSIGNTLGVFSPDEENGVVLGEKIGTLVGKTTNGIVLSGITMPADDYPTTAEFFGSGIVPTGVGFLEISSPDSETVSDILDLVEDEYMVVNYYTPTAPSNNGKLKVAFGIDERLKLDRCRVFLKTLPLSENRTGLATDIFKDTPTTNISVEVLTY